VKRAKLLPAARADLLDIFEFISDETQSVRVAQQYIRKLRAHCNHLASLPFEMGVPRPDLAQDLRSAPFGNYVLFFRYTATRLEIVNIIEGHRDFPARFTPSKSE